MNLLIQRNASILALLVALMTVSFAVLPKTQAAPSPSNVVVVNGPTNPVLTRDTDSAPRHSFTATASDYTFPQSFDITLDMVTVPQGKRLVVEQVSTEYTRYSGQPQLTVSAGLQTTTGGVTTQYFFTGAFAGFILDGNNIYAQFVASSQMRGYADSGTTVRVTVRLDYGADIDLVKASLSGYLIEAP